MRRHWRYQDALKSNLGILSDKFAAVIYTMSEYGYLKSLLRSARYENHQRNT
jgi:hypothetical protein